VLSKSYHPPYRRVVAQSPACSLGLTYVAAHNSSVNHFLFISSARRTHRTLSQTAVGCLIVEVPGTSHEKFIRARKYSTVHDEIIYSFGLCFGYAYVQPRACCRKAFRRKALDQSSSPINVRSAAESVDHHSGPTRKLAMKDRAVGARPNGGAGGRTERPVKLGRPHGET
jgi:hypothetical protein